MKATLLACLFAALAGALATVLILRKPAAPLPDTAAVLLRVRESARLETLTVALYKKISFSPDPQPADSFWSGAAQWARFALHAPQGKAIVFADAHLSIDLRKLDADGLRVEGRRVIVVLPNIETQVELKPGETEIIGSNLDAAETAQLFALAKTAFERTVASDNGLRERARSSAREDLRNLFVPLGFSEVSFVEKLPPARTSD